MIVNSVCSFLHFVSAYYIKMSRIMLCTIRKTCILHCVWGLRQHSLSKYEAWVSQEDRKIHFGFSLEVAVGATIPMKEMSTCE